jgi:mono/diheme cytochrome c family protein
VWAHGAALEDPENKGLAVSAVKTELTDLIENNMAPPVNPMPWWLMKYKSFDYWYGDGNPYDAGHFSFNFTGAQANANDIHADHVASTAKALAFARETVSPEFPERLDAKLVQKGADIFHDRTYPEDWDNFRACFKCHGSYTKIGDNPDFSLPGSWTVKYDGTEYENVRTDTAYNEIVKALGPVNDHITKLQTYFASQEKPELGTIYAPLKGKGYVPPPLVGVWATAPYFHNGSVPTVEAVLNSKLRPEIWIRNEDPNAYDLESMGMVFSTLSREELEESDRIMRTASHLSRESLDQMFIYDTEGFGRGNMGHTFGDQLTQDERLAIMEFLKSLSGPNMPSVSVPKIPDRLAQLGID